MKALNVKIEKYSEKSFLITGDDTRKIKDSLKEFCVWNWSLHGWITKLENADRIKKLTGVTAPLSDTPKKECAGVINLKSFIDYLKFRKLTPETAENSPSGFQAVIKTGKPNVKHFTQVAGNTVRLSYKDLPNKKIIGTYKF